MEETTNEKNIQKEESDYAADETEETSEVIIQQSPWVAPNVETSTQNNWKMMGQGQGWSVGGSAGQKADADDVPWREHGKKYNLANKKRLKIEKIDLIEHDGEKCYKLMYNGEEERIVGIKAMRLMELIK